MRKNNKKSDLYELINIGPKSVRQLESVGIKTIKDLEKIGAEKAYEKMCKKENKKIHRAFLYVMRAALWYQKNKDKRDVAKMWWMFRRSNEGVKNKNFKS